MLARLCYVTASALKENGYSRNIAGSAFNPRPCSTLPFAPMRYAAASLGSASPSSVSIEIRRSSVAASSFIQAARGHLEPSRRRRARAPRPGGDGDSDLGSRAKPSNGPCCATCTTCKASQEKGWLCNGSRSSGRSSGNLRSRCDGHAPGRALRHAPHDQAVDERHGEREQGFSPPGIVDRDDPERVGEIQGIAIAVDER